MKNDAHKKSKQRKVLLIGLISLATGLVSYFGFRFFSKAEQSSGKTDKAPEREKQSGSQARSATRSSSPGEKKTDQPKMINPGLIASGLHAAISKKDFQRSYNPLKALRNVNDYVLVNAVFLKTRTSGKSLSLAEAMLSTFKNKVQQQALSNAFKTIGLKHNGTSWASPASDGKDLLITTQPTKVWADPHTSVQVPSNMVLGKRIAQRGSHTVFENDKRHFLVESNAVKPYLNT